MNVTRGSLLALILVCWGTRAAADDPFNLAVRVDKLATILTQLYGPRGLVLDSLAVLPSGETHSAHFNGAFQSEFTQFTTALTSQLVSVPLPSPASGLTYEFDPNLGVFNRSTDSFGPILAERADTIGSKRVSLGFTYQRYSFDTIEGLDLERVPAVFTHDDFQLGGGRSDVVTTLNSIDASVDQFTAFVTYGLSDRLDVSIAIPVVGIDLLVVSDATVQRVGTPDNDEVHFFRSAEGEVGDRRIFTAFGSATGLGDVTVRVKHKLSEGESQGLAVGLDLRIPTGDEENLLGAGAPGLKPFFIWSDSYGPLSPHAIVGYHWNGSSVLAGNVERGESGSLPDQLLFVVGADLAVSPRFTLSFDLLGQRILDAPRLRREDYSPLDSDATFASIGFENESFNALSGAVGFKLNAVGDVLLDFNLLFNLDDNGLRDKVTPLLGLEYGF